MTALPTSAAEATLDTLTRGMRSLDSQLETLEWSLASAVNAEPDNPRPARLLATVRRMRGTLGEAS